MSSTARKTDQLKLDDTWSELKGIPGIMVSTSGLIMSRSGIRKPFLHKLGYYTINFGSGKNQKTHYVHRLIAETFVPNPEKLPQVNHKNGIKTDNRIDNLEWVSCSQNIKHAYDTGLKIPISIINRKRNEKGHFIR